MRKPQLCRFSHGYEVLRRIIHLKYFQSKCDLGSLETLEHINQMVVFSEASNDFFNEWIEDTLQINNLDPGLSHPDWPT